MALESFKKNETVDGKHLSFMIVDTRKMKQGAIKRFSHYAEYFPVVFITEYPTLTNAFFEILCSYHESSESEESAIENIADNLKLTINVSNDAHTGMQKTRPMLTDPKTIKSIYQSINQKGSDIYFIDRIMFSQGF